MTTTFLQGPIVLLLILLPAEDERLEEAALASFREGEHDRGLHLSNALHPNVGRWTSDAKIGLGWRW